MSIHDHPVADDAQALLDCLSAVAAIHALLPQIGGGSAGAALGLPPDTEIMAAFAAAPKRAQMRCRTYGDRLALMAKSCTETLVAERQAGAQHLGPACERLQREIGRSVAAILALLPAPLR